MRSRGVVVVLVLAAATGVAGFAVPAALKVTPDKENVVASRLAGTWEVD
ncbi:unnamed protein product, partial [marine sediment metagenome]